MQKLTEILLLAMAVALLVFTGVYGVRGLSAEPKAPTIAELNFSEEDCVGLQVVLVETYQAAGLRIDLKDLLDHIREAHIGTESTAADTQFILQTVSMVYSEYPEADTGRRIILECFANAEKAEQSKKSVSR